VQRAAFDEPPLRIPGDATRYDHRDGNVAQALRIDLAEFTRNGAYNSKPQLKKII
jgi:hypothetical protein